MGLAYEFLRLKKTSLEKICLKRFVRRRAFCGKKFNYDLLSLSKAQRQIISKWKSFFLSVVLLSLCLSFQAAPKSLRLIAVYNYLWKTPLALAFREKFVNESFYFPIQQGNCVFFYPLHLVLCACLL
jgi:hypothetical protein